MATIFKDVFKDKLLTVPHSENEVRLPSPEQLKYKIIIKNKKINEQDAVPESAANAASGLVNNSSFSSLVHLHHYHSNRLGVGHGNSINANSINGHQNGIRSSLEDEEEEFDSDFDVEILGNSATEEEEEEEEEIDGITLPLDVFNNKHPKVVQDDFQLHMPTINPRISAARIRSSTVESPVLYHRRRMATNIRKKKKVLVAQELSDLVVYCQSTKFKDFKDSDKHDSPLAGGRLRTPYQASGDTESNLSTTNSFYSNPSSSSASSVLAHNGIDSVTGTSGVNNSASLMASVGSSVRHCYSIHEKRAKSVARESPLRMLEFTESRLVRCYPNGSRISSSNFNPVTMWAAGMQMAALNYQTRDPNMLLNQAFFAQNGHCGYVLKPAVMRSPEHILYRRFNPFAEDLTGLHTTFVRLTIISGQYVCHQDYTASPVVEIELLGLPKDCHKFKTKVASNNALNPIWEETFEMEVSLIELAFLRFNVVDAANNGSVMATQVIPLRQLRRGYRNVPLLDPKGVPLPLSSLFILSVFHSDSLSWHPPNPSSMNGGHGTASDVVGGLSKFRSASVVGRDNSDGIPILSLPSPELLQQKRVSFVVVHDISDSHPDAVLKVTEESTVQDLLKMAMEKAGMANNLNEFVLIEEVVKDSPPEVPGGLLSPAQAVMSGSPPVAQRLLGMEENPLVIRAGWRSGEGKFVVKRVGGDPSWRARLGSTLITGSNSRKVSSAAMLLRQSESLDLPYTGSSVLNTSSAAKFTAGDEDDDLLQQQMVQEDAADQFLVCIYNVSPGMDHTILQMERTATAMDVIATALAKTRRNNNEDVHGFVLVEETEIVVENGNQHQYTSGGIGGGSGQRGISSVVGTPTVGRRGGGNNKRAPQVVQRVLSDDENVYLVQNSWRAHGKLTLMERTDKTLAKVRGIDNHPSIRETQSDPIPRSSSIGGRGLAVTSARFRRHNLVNNFRRFSRSLYSGTSTLTGAMGGESSSTNHQNSRTSIGGRQTPAEIMSEGDLSEDEDDRGRRSSMANFRKLKIW